LVVFYLPINNINEYACLSPLPHKHKKLSNVQYAQREAAAAMIYIIHIEKMPQKVITNTHIAMMHTNDHVKQKRKIGKTVNKQSSINKRILALSSQRYRNTYT